MTGSFAARAFAFLAWRLNFPSAGGRLIVEWWIEIKNQKLVCGQDPTKITIAFLDIVNFFCEKYAWINAWKMKADVNRTSKDFEQFQIFISKR
jgi:hypothetical protein